MFTHALSIGDNDRYSNIDLYIAAHQIEHVVKRVQGSGTNLLLTLEPGCVGDVRFGCEELRCEDELFLPLYDEQFVLAIPWAHSLADIDTPTSEDLHDLCWVMCPQNASHQRLLPVYGATAHSPAANADTFRMALSLAVAGLGAVIAPESLVREHAGLMIKPLPGYSMTRRVGICYAVQALTMPSVALLLQRVSVEQG